MVLEVDLAELRGYADAIDDISRDAGGVEHLVASTCVTTDFGKIVEEMTADYAILLPQVKEVLAETEDRLARYARNVDLTAADFLETDDGVASRFQGDGIDARPGTANFALASVGTQAPSATEGELPEVSFGFLFDKLAWALEKFTGWDVRAEVTDWIAGDVVTLSLQADCWRIAGERFSTITDNFTDSSIRIQKTWRGDAAAEEFPKALSWSFVLGDHASAMKDLGANLRDLAKEAVNVAQLVVDCIRLAVDLIASAWALQYIPVVGQVKFVQKAWDAYKRAKKAIAYLQMIVSALRFTKSLIVVMIDSITVEKLPGVPAHA